MTEIDLNSKIKDVSRSILYDRDFLNLLNENWKPILENLTSVKNGEIKIEKKLISNLEQTSNPAIDVIGFMIGRSIILADLYESFESLNLEKGLEILKKPEIDLVVVNEPPKTINVKQGHVVQILCDAIGFPKPSIEYFNQNNQLVSNTNSLKINNARRKDEGLYFCIVTQKKKNNQIKKMEYKIELNVYGDNEEEEKLSVSVEPHQMTVEFCNEARLYAVVNEEDQKILEFQWFKFNTNSSQFEYISDNPTANKRQLIIKRFEPPHVGTYKVQVTRHGSQTEKVFSSNCGQLLQFKQSEYDLKIALLIGNGNYERYNIDLESCERCEIYKLSNINVYDSVERIKSKLESYGYLTVSFVDLDSEQYLRVIKFFRQLCLGAHNISVLVYVAGHGFNYNKQDYLIPIDSRILMHNNSHDYHGIEKLHGMSSLENLFEIFSTDSLSQKFSLVCLWDLCRVSWFDMNLGEKTDKDLLLNGSLEYSLLYSCNVGTNSYDLKIDKPEYGLRKGTIFTSLFLNNLKKNVSLNDIGENINENIERLKKADATFNVISRVKFQTTCQRINFGSKANDNFKYLEPIKSLTLSEEYTKINHIFDNMDLLVCSYRFLPDIFLNSVLVEIEIKDRFELKSQQSNSVFIEEIESKHVKKRLFRVTNILTQKALTSQEQISFVIRSIKSDMEEIVHLKIPAHYHKFFCLLNSDEINEYINDKKKINVHIDIFSLRSENPSGNTSEYGGDETPGYSNDD